MVKMAGIDDVEELRQYLEKRREELEEELRRINRFLKALEDMITEKSFSPADKIKPLGAERPEPREPMKTEWAETSIETKPQQEKPLRTEILWVSRGRPVAWVDHYPHAVVVRIDKSFGFRVDDTLVTRFLEPRLTEEMSKDMREIDEGKRPKDKRFSFHILDEDGIVTRIEVVDHGEVARRRDTIGKIRWALKKFEEKKMGENL